MSVNTNPSPCCAEKTACCNKPVKDVIDVEVSTDCGTFTGQVRRIENPTYPTWFGEVTISCKEQIFGGCVPRTISLTLSCGEVGAGKWFLNVGGTFSADPGSTCETMVFSVGVQFGCLSPATITFRNLEVS